MKLEHQLFKLSNFLIIIFPIVLITGSFLTDLTVIFLGISFLILSYRKDGCSFIKEKIFFFFFIIFFYLNLNSIFSFDPKISFRTTLPFLRSLIFIFALSFFLQSNKKLYLYFFFSFLFCILILLGDSIYTIFNQHNIFGQTNFTHNRISSFFGKKLIMGSYVTRLLPLVLGISFFLKIKNFQRYNYLILLISFILVLLSGERLAFVYFVMVFFFYVYLDFKKIYFYYFFIALTTIVSIFYLFDIKPLKRLTTHSYAQYKETNSLVPMSFRHYTHYLTAYKMFLDSKLLGHGVGAFRYLCADKKYVPIGEILNKNLIKSPTDGYFDLDLNDRNFFSIKTLDGVQNKYTYSRFTFFKIFVPQGYFVYKDQLLFSSYEFENGCNTHPHNFYMQFLAELGLIGFGLFFSIFIFISYKLIRYCYFNYKKKMKNHEKGSALILFGIFVIMFPILPSGNFFNNWLMAITFLPVGFYLSFILKK
jgi:O-antigen ligase